jgi:hypothetical protein
MTKGSVGLPVNIGEWLRKQQIPPLRYASVGMTKESVVLPIDIG